MSSASVIAAATYVGSIGQETVTSMAVERDDRNHADATMSTFVYKSVFYN